MKRVWSYVTALAAIAVVAGCSTARPAASGAAAPPAAASAEQRGIVGTPRPGGKFALLRLGMDMEQVQTVMGSAPHRTDSHETGKRWIPFYFGTDARRLEALYRGDGCLTFTGGNIWGGAGGELIAIENDPSGKCFDS